VAAALNAVNVGFESCKDQVIWDGREILTQAGAPYTVFTPYARAWRSREVPPPLPKLGRARHTDAAGLPVQSTIPDAATLGIKDSTPLPAAGEKAALTALKKFLAGPVAGYAAARNFPADPRGTSRLSHHLRFGTLGPRTLLARLAEARAALPPQSGDACRTWETELIWREFYQMILANFPHVAKGSFRPAYDQLQWSGSDAWFDAWCTGQTGFPVVDAAMRCLNATGLMHNRLRMITAMFLTKDLLISWQRGERYFMSKLLDGDLAANNGGWQWSAGCGTDAAPYFRIFNPVSQSQKFDPAGEFIRQWVPELRAHPRPLAGPRPAVGHRLPGSHRQSRPAAGPVPRHVPAHQILAAIHVIL
jgi:deoxyribodipyrimidine photo-lyase